ncbi:protein Dok-7 [Myxocyprinus asiaticus]|uniref:protein Dok-7 n=1 Tax=Myxocyprinus asiaticus TaxID=70543 RepID=UPI002222DA59|nr:protein Dok-7 [Myxocyprinus asiaticus]
MSDTVIAEGAVKIRDGKKWKSRWLVLRKPSPVADCLVMHVYKERGVKERSSVTLEHICGLEARVDSDGIPFTLSILCLTQTAVLGFDSKEALQSWDLRLRYCLGEVHSFSVSVLPGTKLESGPATLHLCNNLLVLAKDLLPVVIGHWNLLDLRRYGPVHNGFVFEGGARCGYWAGVFFLSCADGEQISFLFDCVVRGISPSRVPFGLKPLLPEPNVSAASVQDRLNHEAEELERRLDLLSQSTASSSNVGSSVAGDDRSISGSSDTSDASQSNCTIRHSTGCLRVPLDPVHSRKLKETDRQNSSDSGIATGSHSSFTGSFSFYSGILEAPGQGEEYGMLLNIPPPVNPEKHLCTCPPCPTNDYQVPLSLRYLYDTPRSLLEIGRTSEDTRDRSRSKNDTGLVDWGQTEQSVRKQSECPSQSDSGPVLIYTDRIEETLRTLELDREEGLKTKEELYEEKEPKKGEVSQRSSCSKSCCDCATCLPLPVASKSLFTTCPNCGGLKGALLPQPGVTFKPTVPGKYRHTLRASGVTSAGEHSEMLASDVTSQPTNQKLEVIRESCPSLPNHDTWKQSPECILTNEEGGSDGYISCLSDLLAHYGPTGKSDLRSVNGSSYEPMSPSVVPVGSECRRPAHSIPSLLYENCLQCRRGEGMSQLRKPTPPSRDVFPQEQERFRQEQSGGLSEEYLRISEEDNRQRICVEKGRTDPAYEIMDSRVTERSFESEKRSRNELMASCSGSQFGSHHFTDGGVFAFPVDGSAAADRPRGDTVTYVNIPTSPTSKKQLHYMELELQEAITAIRGKSSSKYAQIDIAATEAAHRAGTQHALVREEGLQRPEKRRSASVMTSSSLQQ